MNKTPNPKQYRLGHLELKFQIHLGFEIVNLIQFRLCWTANEHDS
jgi:hypothetical protein